MGVFKQESKNGLESLQDLMDKVIARRSQLYAVVEDQPLKLPSRMSATGDKKVQYYEKLSNPDVPLHELTRVQHQLRTADSLEAIYAQKVPADRTFWYIRALGAIEVVGKYKPGAAGNHSGVIPEWTAALTAFLKRQLSEIAMPAVSRTGTNIKQVFKKAKLSDPEGREAWIDKFSWSLELLRRLFDADLIDQPSFLAWVVTSMGHTEAMGPHQFIFLIRMVDEYFDSVASNRAFATPIIEACLSRFAEIDVSPVKQYATCILDELSSLILLNNLMLYHAMDDELLVSTVRSILRHLTTWISMSRVDRIVDVLLETNARLKEQTRKNAKPIISLLQELDRCCILSSNTKGRIQNELNEARKVLLSEHSSSSPAPPILPFILAAIQENSLEQPTDVATTMWYKNHAHANWGSASWDAVVAAVGSRAWDPSVPDQTMAERFTSLVRCIDAHLPDGIQDVIRIWFETTGAERMSEALDDEWHIIEHMALSLTCAGIISPQTALDGLVYPMWNRCFQPQKMADDSSPFLRTLPLASAILLCDSPRCSGDGDFVLQLEICRTRCSRPSNFPSILRATYALAALEQSPSKDPAVGEQIAAIRRRLIQDSYLRHTVLSRTQLQEEVFEKIIAEYPELKAALIPNLKESLQDMSVALQTGEEPMFASQWARVMTTVDFWSFPVAKLSLRLYLEQLRQKALRDQVASGGIQPLDDSYLESLASVLSEGQLSSSGISLMTELVRGAEPALPEKIVRHGLEQLSSCFSSTEPDDPVQFLAFAKEILRLIVTFRRIETTPAPLIWPADLQDEFLRKWADKVSALQQSIQENKKRLRGQDIQEIADTICVMMRVLHLFSELFGPDLGLKVVPLISTIIQLAVMFGGGVTYDDMTFSILMDTVCILMDDCSKETRIHVQNALTQVANIALPSHLPAPSRYRIESILPFNPQDKTVSNLGQARRVNGDLEYISTVRNQSWGWMESVDPQEPPSVLSTRVRSSAAMRLELFETTSKGESILSDKRISDTSKQAGDLWLFRDGMASEGLLARAWRESRTAAAWDVKSMDESITSERISSSRGFSPAASRSSAHMSTSSRRGSPSQNLRGHGIPTVETLDAEPLVDSKPPRTLKRKERVEEEDADGDVVMLEDHRVGSKTTQVKRPKNKVKVKR
ncbi:hypothetical protein M408DRAFT_22702 [Serendipita vermifera MAFF 305830]|uniref:Mediator of RNA polymerase II transcription subunit 12 n=1 Tax=Serendipita vermifera MAFF 305830 TaxID=933852 RepID=A0A0C3BED5_SERVB|nr:hypothetical protein M408DRAFT_22702 [Serendipita vermifera MAFF 305830]